MRQQNHRGLKNGPGLMRSNRSPLLWPTVNEVNYRLIKSNAELAKKESHVSSTLCISLLGKEKKEKSLQDIRQFKTTVEEAGVSLSKSAINKRLCEHGGSVHNRPERLLAGQTAAIPGQ